MFISIPPEISNGKDKFIRKKYSLEFILHSELGFSTMVFVCFSLGMSNLSSSHS